MRRSAHIAVRASEASRSKAFAQRILLAMSATIAGVWLALASLPATGSDIQRVAVLEAHVDTLLEALVFEPAIDHSEVAVAG